MLAVLLYLAWNSGLLGLLSSENIDAFAAYLRSFGVWTPIVSILLLILETVIPPLPAWPILIANAAIYGLWGGIALSWVGGVLGAIAIFWLARAWGRAYVERMIKPEHLHLIDEISRKNGFQILLFARILPVTSLDILSALAGLSSISFGRFLLATSIGLIPGIATYTLFAHDLLKIKEYSLRFSILLILFLAVLAALKYRAHLIRLWKKVTKKADDPV